MLTGQYIITPFGQQPIVVPNQAMTEGKQRWLEMVCRNDGIGGDGEFYLGLCGDDQGVLLTLADLTAEPSNAGYARKQLDRNSTDWPLIDLAGDVPFAETKELTFTPSGAAYNTTVFRCFLCNVTAGSAGVLFSVSAPFPAGQVLADGVPFKVKYRLYWQ